MTMPNCIWGRSAILLLLLAQLASAEKESFDRDPAWEGWNNRMVPKSVPTIKQDFGYGGRTHLAGKETGEIGGNVWRSTKPAYYADKIAPKTLEDRLNASGTFAFTASAGSSGLFFGWFNAKQPGGSRPIQSLGLDFDGEPRGLRLAVRMISGSNKSCGTFITPFIPGKFRPTPIRNDGTRYTWTLTYDHDANDRKGRFQFTIKSNSPQPEPFEGKVFSVDLPDGFKGEEMVFDRFGMMNMQRPGNALAAYFDDLRYDGKAEDFAKDPGWEGSGNRDTYQPQDVGGFHNFGFSPGTCFAGGSPGEMGGVLWRTGKNWGYYADRVEPLSLDDRLEARGKVILAVGAPDSGAFLGWFSSEAKDKRPTDSENFVGVAIAGPTRVGHYFRPLYATAKGNRGGAEKAPVIVPFRPHEWSLTYDPAANDGNGAIRVTLDRESVTVNLKAGHKQQGARLDRFGLFTASAGGSLVKIYVDDLKYTARRRTP